jgi:hypothetical protein
MLYNIYVTQYNRKERGEKVMKTTVDMYKFYPYEEIQPKEITTSRKASLKTSNLVYQLGKEQPVHVILTNTKKSVKRTSDEHLLLSGNLPELYWFNDM